MTASILTPRQKCHYYCDQAMGSPRRTGDVRRCQHGKIWIAEQYFHDYRWRRLYQVLRPVLYRRAVRALGGVK